MFDLPPNQLKIFLEDLRTQRRECEEQRRQLKMSRQPFAHIDEQIARLKAQINTAQACLLDHYKGVSQS